MKDKKTLLEQKVEGINKVTKHLLKNDNPPQDVLINVEDFKKNLDLLQVKEEPKEEQLQDIIKPKEEQLQDINGHISKNSKCLENVDVLKLASEVFNIQDVKRDFNFILDNLKINVETTKEILEELGEDLSMCGLKQKSCLVSSYASLNNSQLENLKMFINSYKDLTNVLTNINKLNKNETPHNNYTTNVLNVDGKNSYCVSDIIKKLSLDENK